MIETKHYLHRIHERGFSPDSTKVILNYGEWNRRGDQLIITKASKDEIISEVKKIQNEIRSLCNKKEYKQLLKFLKKEILSLKKIANRSKVILVLKENHLITIY